MYYHKLTIYFDLMITKIFFSEKSFGDVHLYPVIKTFANLKGFLATRQLISLDAKFGIFC